MATSSNSPHRLTAGLSGNIVEQSSPPDGRFISVSAGWDHSCGVMAGGSMACWGDNNNTKSLERDGHFTDLRAGGGYTCGLRQDGTVVCWRNNDIPRMTDVPEGVFIALDSSASVACAVRTDGAIVCWGAITGDVDQVVIPPR